jgi:hypothetical protein
MHKCARLLADSSPPACLLFYIEVEGVEVEGWVK